MVVDKDNFLKKYRQLMSVTIQKNRSYGTTEIAFDKGFWRAEEWYKKELWAKAQTMLNLSSWATLNPTKITEIIRNVLWLGASGKGHLISKENVLKVLPCITAYSEAYNYIYALYMEQDEPEKIFDGLYNIFRRAKAHDPYSVIAYLFFVKDKEKYIPMRERTYSLKCLPQLKIPSKLVQECTWENYMALIDAVKQIQTYLLERIEIVDLLDAQSFLWMMHYTVGNPEEYDPDDVGYNETKVTYYDKGAEGRKTEYYVTKYERSPKNRRLAIKAHGCVCAVCKFDFAKTYGEELGAGFIEVHHIMPLSSMNEEREVDPETEMVCLCANCHRMIHRKKNKVLTVDELKAQYKAAKNSQNS